MYAVRWSFWHARPGRHAKQSLQQVPRWISALTLIADGQLWYRGQNAVELAAHSTLEEVACLLWQCEEHDPFAMPLRDDCSIVDVPEVDLPKHLHPLEQAMVRFPALALVANRSTSEAASSAQHLRCAYLLRAMTAALLNTGVQSDAIHLQCAKAWGLDAEDADRIRHALVLCADHELNASSFAARCVASTGAALHAAVLGGLAALSGPRHGLASERVETILDEVAILTSEQLTSWFEGRVSLSGFGHRLYPTGDVRAGAILARLSQAYAPDLCKMAKQFCAERPNLDFALVALRRSLGLPPHSASVVFALGRTVGWLAHALEQGAHRQIIRPRAQYVGVAIPSPGVNLPKGRVVRMGRG